MNKTLYISDLDGTLLNKSAELSEQTANALNEMIDKGMNFSVATARTLATTGKILAELALRIPIILMNGVLIYDIEQQCYVQINALPPETVTAIVTSLKTLAVTGVMYELKDNVLMTYYETLEQKPLRDFVEERMTRYNKAFSQTDSFSAVSPEHIIYFSLLDTLERLQPVRDALMQLPGLNLTLYRDVYSTDQWFLEMFNASASKRNAVSYLREAYGFDRIVGFGDNYNDLPLFAACDVRVAVENANPEVKAAADYICGAHYDDDVVKWLAENAL